MIQFLINAIIWLLICNISVFCTKFTTIAQYNWFFKVFFAIENFAEYKLKNKKLAKKILNFSYSKAFYCKPCHSFWLSIPMFYNTLQIESFFWLLFFTLLLSLNLYFSVKLKEQRNAEKQKQGATS